MENLIITLDMLRKVLEWVKHYCFCQWKNKIKCFYQKIGKWLLFTNVEVSISPKVSSMFETFKRNLLNYQISKPQILWYTNLMFPVTCTITLGHVQTPLWYHLIRQWLKPNIIGLFLSFLIIGLRLWPPKFFVKHSAWSYPHNCVLFPCCYSSSPPLGN